MPPPSGMEAQGRRISGPPVRAYQEEYPPFEEHSYTVLVLAYVVMRVAMIAQWLRASRGAGAIRRATQIYAGGIAGVQVLWLLVLLLSG
ncbi:MAG: low temperature requirement protein A, partial [Rhodospirillales bacterium]|nr:low temperature requirement protein A [Acetobacter sp.]